MMEQPTDDDWYRVSTNPLEVPVVDGGETFISSYYLPLEPASPLGCIEQHQFCRTTSNSRECGPLASLRDAIACSAPFFNSSYTNFRNDIATTSQEALFLYSIRAIYQAPRVLDDIIGQLGSKALRSERTLINGYQVSLPSNQWQIDVTNWFEVGHAAMQAAYLEMAYGTANPDLLRAYVNFTTPELNSLCNSQVHDFEIFSFSLCTHAD